MQNCRGSGRNHADKWMVSGLGQLRLFCEDCRLFLLENVKGLGLFEAEALCR